MKKVLLATALTLMGCATSGSSAKPDRLPAALATIHSLGQTALEACKIYEAGKGRMREVDELADAVCEVVLERERGER